MTFIHSFVEMLLNIDHSLFAIINQQWTNEYFDWFFPQITDLHRDPRALYVVIPLVAFWIFKQRSYALRCLLAVVLSIALADSIAYRAIKGVVQRARPMDANITAIVRTPRHAGFSFPSNHASNMFAIATIMSLALPAVAPIFFIIAFLVAYSRVYVGVHFPFDVLGGAILGSLMARLVWRLLRKWIGPSPSEFNTPSRKRARA